MAAGPIVMAAADATVSFLWTVSMSALGAATAVVAWYLRVEGDLSKVLITVAIFAILIAVFEGISSVLGGASYSPTNNASLYAAGLGNDSLLSMAVRFPAQAIGAVVGTMSIIEAMPPEYKHTLVAPSLKVDMHSGAMAEGGLTFIMTFVVLWIMIKGPKNPLLQLLIATMTTVGVVLAGSGYTGPALNPVNAFGWAYIENTHNTWEHYYVYWISPIFGAILAAWVFKFIFPSPPDKVKMS